MKPPHALGILLSLVLVTLLVACANGGKGGLNLQNVDINQLVQNVKGLREVSEPEEIQIGDGVTETLLGARPLQDDVELQRYVNVVGLWVARQSERPNLPWHFAVNDSDYINAFATPGGNIVITKGMIRVLHNESELAGVIGHEVSHVVRKHHLNAIRKNSAFGLLMQGVQAGAGNRSQDVVNALAGPTKELYARGLDKSDEFEADRMGVVIAARAGYDPWGLPAALQTLAGVNPDDDYVKLLFKTHPAPSARLEKLAVALGTNFDSVTGGPQSNDQFLRITERVRAVAAK
ncbi:MAG TPA: M48 family metalloprotease [Burkholderiales bacterium]|nr:M48 family metalloprotease [Burkholderiales bacterium]